MMFVSWSGRRPARAVLIGLVLAATALVGSPVAPAVTPSVSDASLATVTFAGRTARVPAAWPVFDLDADPTTCARFNRDAVYLGHPGGNQLCPSRPLGLGNALQIEALDEVSASRVQPSTVRLSDGDALPEELTAAGGTQFTVVLTDAALVVTAGFYDDPAPIRRAIEDLLGTSDIEATDTPPEAVPTTDVPPVDAPATPAPAPDTTMSTPSTSAPADTVAPEIDENLVPEGSTPLRAGDLLTPSTTVAAPTTTLIGEPAARRVAGAPSTLGAPTAPAGPDASSLQAGHIIGFSFDTCAAPSLNAMQAWLRSPYRTAGVYLGGMNVGCPTSVIDRDWVDATTAMGWSLMPIYVGRQAPIDICGCASIRTSPSSKPRADGAAAADHAVRLAKAAGLKPGTIIYYDMEGYDTSIAANTPAVMKFLSAWTMRLHELGYLSAIYSSSASGIRDLANYDGRAGHHSPDTIWMANWNGKIATYGDRWVPNTKWRSKRVHQFYGARDETWGGVRINIDPNINNGIVNCPGGACVSAVAHKYDLLGGEARHLRDKLSGEKATRDGTGRYTRYRSGVIVSSWENGVFEVHGDIYLKWQTIGATTSKAGYPRADTRTGTDGISRYTTFQTATIWYTPARKTWVISGAIRNKYNAMKNVSGPMGYPTSDIYSVGSSKRMNFSRGTLTESPSGRVTVAYY